MWYKNKRNRRITQLIGSGVGLIIVLTFVISLLNIDTLTDNGDDLDVTPFGTPPPPTPVIIPTPDPDPQIDSAPLYIHSSGYFQAFQPAGADWTVSENPPGSVGGFANVVVQNQDWLVVVLHELQPGVEYESADSLSENLLTAGRFASVWLEYDFWAETGRAINGDRVTVEFDLALDDNAYLGRTVSWLDGGWLYDLRLVVPGNDPALLDLLAERFVPAFVGYHDLQQLPQIWPTYLDRELGFILKYPPFWEQIAGGAGRPATFSGRTDQPRTIVRLWTEDGAALTSGEEAEDWVLANEATASIVETASVERETGSGYQVAYTYRDTSGDEHSGLTVLLHDTADRLYVADLQIDPPGVNLLEDSEELSDEDRAARQAVADGFVILPPGARLDQDEAD